MFTLLFWHLILHLDLIIYEYVIKIKNTPHTFHTALNPELLSL